MYLWPHRELDEYISVLHANKEDIIVYEKVAKNRKDTIYKTHDITVSIRACGILYITLWASDSNNGLLHKTDKRTTKRRKTTNKLREMAKMHVESR